MPKVVVDQITCIGCSTCALIDPETFYMDQSDFKAKVKHQPEVNSDILKNSIDSCPVGAISITEN